MSWRCRDIAALFYLCLQCLGDVTTSLDVVDAKCRCRDIES